MSGLRPSLTSVPTLRISIANSRPISFRKVQFSTEKRLAIAAPDWNLRGPHICPEVPKNVASTRAIACSLPRIEITRTTKSARPRNLLTEQLILAIGVYPIQHSGSKQLRLLTAEGMRNIDDAWIICTNRPRSVAEHLLVTVFLLTGEQVTGVVDVAEPSSSPNRHLWPRDAGCGCRRWSASPVTLRSGLSYYRDTRPLG